MTYSYYCYFKSEDQQHAAYPYTNQARTPRARAAAGLRGSSALADRHAALSAQVPAVLRRAAAWCPRATMNGEP